MSVIKKLAGQTAIYGLSSMIGRFLNFLLVPLYTSTVFTLDQFGIVTKMYAFVGFAVVALTYGMETAYFRFITEKEANPKKVYSTTLSALFSTTTLFIVLALMFSQDIANLMGVRNHNEYVIWFAIIVGLDAISAIPLAKLRADSRPMMFAAVNFVNIGVNIGLNLFFLVYCAGNYNAGNTNWLIDTFYNPNLGVAYVFLSNLAASIIKFVVLIPFMSIKGGFDLSIFKKMFKYAYPMLFVGLAGIVNEMLDRIVIDKIEYHKMLPTLGHVQAQVYADVQNALYGANYKLAMIIYLFIQAFRFAAEPFFFSYEKNKDAKQVYVKIMNYFTFVTLIMFLIITLYLDVFKLFIRQVEYREGLHIVPILLGAYFFLGFYVNQSIWYKLSHNTKYGAYITVFGAIITIVINFTFIPVYGYEAAAWATLICYASMSVISYFLGQKLYPIPYNLKKIIGFTALAFVLFMLRAKFELTSPETIAMSWQGYVQNTVLLLIFLTVVMMIEKPQKLLLSRR